MQALLAALLAALLPSAAVESGDGQRPSHDAKFIGMTDVPAKLLAGQVFYVEIVMENTGSSGWGPENEKHVVLRAQDPADNETWGTFFINQGQGTDVPAGKRFAFHSWLMAPLTPGEHTFRWRLGKTEGEGYAGKVTLFGEATPARTIVVERRPGEAAGPAPAQPPSSKRVLGFDDFEYAGSFKVPDREGHDLPFSHSGLALRRMPDGSRRIFFNYTHPKQALVELGIPPLVKLDGKKGVGDLKVAETKKVWGKLEIAVPREKLSNARDTIFADGGFCWDEARRTLWWTWWDSYWCGDPPPVLAATRLGEDGSVTHLGSWTVRPGMYKWYWGGVLRLPAGFAARHAPGKTMALGFGTGYSGTFAGSLGPSLSFIPDPDPERDEVQASHALGYYGGERAPRDGRYFIATVDATDTSWMGRQPESPEKGTCGSGDLSRSGILIDAPAAHAFIAFMNLQVGRIGYDYGSAHTPRTVNCWYFYDPDALAAAARGERKPSVPPTSRTEVPSPGGKDPRPSLPDAITGSCFDEEEGLLYVYTFLTARGAIHAYRLKAGIR